MTLLTLCNYAIRYSFYGLFFLVPLVFTTDNSELFELSKMWLTWGLTIIITASWLTKMIITKQFRVQRTPLDIPIALFLGSQLLATLLSLDMRVSLWGYYSRFNGGLFSILAYITLYYAFVTNLNKKHVVQTLVVSLVSGLIVTLWGIPAHFGYDPTCFVVRGSFDISCWTEQFVPTVRIFSTLGQPAWMAAFLAFLIPVSLAFFVKSVLFKHSSPSHGSPRSALRALLSPLAISYLLLSVLLHTALIFANTRAGYLGFVVGFVFFWIVLFWSIGKKALLPFFATTILVVVASTIFGLYPVHQLHPLTLGDEVQEALMKREDQATTANARQTEEESAPDSNPSDVPLITDSGNIRKNVWRGAVSAWQAYPIFGTGVETFAFAYYQYKPPEQSLTSEWDYLYNKAHNEYLNYLATTGIVGLATYLLLIGWFWYTLLRWFLKNRKRLSDPNESKATKRNMLLVLGLAGGLITIYITNFFGFSVVLVNLYLFLAPAWAFLLTDSLDPDKAYGGGHRADNTIGQPGTVRWVLLAIVWLISLYVLFLLFRFWQADKLYAYGYNLNRVGQIQEAYPFLVEAVNKRSHEPVFMDELAYGSAALASAYARQEDLAQAQAYTQQALQLSEEVARNHPNNIVAMKNRVRMLHELAQIDPQYLTMALLTIQKAYERAPNDAKIGYNYGVLLGQTGNVQQGIDVLEKIKVLKPDFRDVYFALGLFYRDLATEGTEIVQNQEPQEKAEEAMQYILDTINPDDEQVTETLNSWK